MSTSSEEQTRLELNNDQSDSHDGASLSFDLSDFVAFVRVYCHILLGMPDGVSVFLFFPLPLLRGSTIVVSSDLHAALAAVAQD